MAQAVPIRKSSSIDDADGKGEADMRRKVVAICGSMRFWEIIQKTCERLEPENEWVLLGLTPHVLLRELAPQEKARLDALHRDHIDLADAVFVVNVDGDIGGRRSAMPGKRVRRFSLEIRRHRNSLQGGWIKESGGERTVLLRSVA